jgi:PAS domain S-box-containing protein
MGLLFLCAGLIGPFLSSFLDAGLVSLNHFGDRQYWHVWRMRFCSNVFTAMALLPFIVTWGQHPFRQQGQMRWSHRLEVGAVYLALLLISIVVFNWQMNGPATITALLYLPMPLLLWNAVRFGPTGTSTAILTCALLAIGGAVHGRGPFVSHSPEQNALSIQAFFTVSSLSLMSLAASLADRRKAEERFTAAFRANPDAMIICRRTDGRILDINHRCEQLLQSPAPGVVGRPITELEICASPEERNRLLATWAGGLHGQEVCLREPSGELHHTLVSADTDEVGGDPCSIITIHDVTDRKRAEEAQQNLAHASRLAVMGELTAMVAHEVNQPLGAILSNADAAEILLQAKEPRLDEVREIIADIRRNDLRADEAIRRIRGLLRKREMQMEALDLNETAADVVRLVTGDAMWRRVQLRKEFAPRLPAVFGDRVHLQQVLLNLIVNAMDALTATPEPSRQIRLQTRLNGTGDAEVVVSDSGPGIDQDKMARIFDSFFTTKREGMGLGLSIARSIVEAHHGRISVERNSMGGATFRVTLPTLEGAAGSPTVETKNANQQS